jgi:hypothetical protein
MAFFQIDRNANSANNVIQLKSALIQALATAQQIQRETANMTQAQVESHYGLPPELLIATWGTTVDGVVTSLEVAAVDNYISQLG